MNKWLFYHLYACKKKCECKLWIENIVKKNEYVLCVMWVCVYVCVAMMENKHAFICIPYIIIFEAYFLPTTAAATTADE